MSWLLRRAGHVTRLGAVLRLAGGQRASRGGGGPAVGRAGLLASNALEQDSSQRDTGRQQCHDNRNVDAAMLFTLVPPAEELMLGHRNPRRDFTARLVDRL